MTPLQIEIVLHYYVRPTDYRDGDFTAPAVSQALDHFKRAGVLKDATGPTAIAPTSLVTAAWPS